MYRTFGKRLLDLALVIPALILLLPVMLLVALLIWRKMGAPVIFYQERAGFHGKPFKIYKFRTMTNACDAQGRPLPDHQRITPLGRFLRSTSLDELPQLFNVLRGEMSLIGPRPLLVKYLDRYSPEQARRHNVRPGIAGLPALFGRSEQSWDDILARDVWYVDHLSFWLDLKIIVGTLLVVLKRDGVARSADGFVPEFTGSSVPCVEEPVVLSAPTPPAPALVMTLTHESDRSVTV
ncbi:MAG: sugar transferase [Chloroflexi bacterium]|nr:sugar transferase [Chloroflexota bacterium]